MLRSEFNALNPREVEELYDEMLNEIYPVVRFGDLTYWPARVLKDVDPTAYRVGLSDYLDSLEEDLEEDDE